MALFTTILNVLLVVCSLFLICLVLIQRGKGGGLAGAFGGVGGSSAFGTKAGDVFTRITIIVAGIWIALNMVLVILANQRATSAFAAISTPSTEKKVEITPDGASGPSSPAKAGAGRPPAAAPEAPASSSSLPSALDDPAPPPSAPIRPAPAKTP